MDNNKNRQKDRPKSNAELRKMYSESGAEIGIENGKKKGSHSNGKKFTKRSKLSHNKWYNNFSYFLIICCTSTY